jgi:hypothetical protein
MQTPENTRKAKIVALHEEMEAIHFENKVYWDQGLDHSDDAIAVYGRRQSRLEELRKEVAQLRLE